MNVIKGAWENVHIYCVNHEEPVEMVLVANEEFVKTPFFACGNYAKSGSDYCANRLNMDDYQGLVLKFFDMVASEGPGANLTNLRFIYKGTRHKIRVRVLKHSDSSIKLGIENLSVLGGR